MTVQRVERGRRDGFTPDGRPDAFRPYAVADGLWAIAGSMLALYSG